LPFNFPVTALDASNSPVSGYAGTVHFSSTDAQAGLPANSTLTNGAGSFSATLKTLGNQTISATDTVTPAITGTSNAISIIQPTPLTITSGQPPDGTVGEGYGFRLTASGGLRGCPFTGGYSWSASSLPPGLQVSKIAPMGPELPFWEIDGTPSAAGTYTNVVITVTDFAAGKVSKSYKITISAAAGANPASKSEPNRAAQTYTTTDFPGAISTQLSAGPNPQGTSVGTYTDAFGVIHGFALTKKGEFTPVDPPGSTLTTPGFISPQGDIVGVYVDARGVSHGFILSGGKFENIDFPGATGTALSGLNPSGEMSGFTCSDPACGLTGAFSIFHSFVISKTGVFTSFDPPGAISSNASAVNPSGEVVGAYTDSAGIGHGYIFDHGTFTTIDFPGATFTFIGGGNAVGDVVGLYNDAAGVGHSFLRSKGEFTSFDPPGATFSLATGINPAGIIVGAYFDSVGVEHGYIRTPK
jgi:hypothetical protein